MGRRLRRTSPARARRRPRRAPPTAPTRRPPSARRSPTPSTRTPGPPGSRPSRRRAREGDPVYSPWSAGSRARARRARAPPPGARRPAPGPAGARARSPPPRRRRRAPPRPPRGRQASPEIDQEPRAVTPRARRVRARRRVPHHRLDGVGARENRADGDDGGGARRGVRRVGVCALPADELRDLLALAPQHDRADARGARSQNLQMRGGARGRAAAERRPRRDARRRAERRCRDAAPREAEARRLGEDGLIFGRDGGGLAHDLHSEAHVLRRAALAAEHAQAHWSHQPVHRRVPRPARVERRAQKRILARGGGGDHLHGGRLRTVLGHLRRRPRGEDLRADLLGRHAPERVRRVQRLL